MIGREQGHQILGLEKNDEKSLSQQTCISLSAATASIVPTLPFDNAKGLFQTGVVKSYSDLITMFKKEPARMFRGGAKVPFSVAKQTSAFTIFEKAVSACENRSDHN